MRLEENKEKFEEILELQHDKYQCKGECASGRFTREIVLS